MILTVNVINYLEVIPLSFEEVIDRRSTQSIKWNRELLEKWCHMSGEDILSFWVADMDFRCPQPVIDAVKNVADFGIYGYSDMSGSYYQCVLNWYLRRYGCALRKEWICYCNGIVPALNYVLQGFCQPGDKLLIQPPVYYPFQQAAENNGVELLTNDLVLENGKYRMDFEDLERKASDPRARVLFLCSPHNPVGRVWTQKELRQVADICKAHNILVVSDEIHCDIVYSPHRFYSMLAFEELYDRLILCSSPSKTFNIAGLQMSNIMIPSTAVRRQFQKVLDKNSVLLPNVFGIAAVEAAYSHCDGWLAELLSALTNNRNALGQALSARLPKAVFHQPEGTYLAWVDLSAYPYTPSERGERIKAAGLALDHGSIFGPPGDSFERINFACPEKTLLECVGRLAAALQ